MWMRVLIFILNPVRLHVSMECLRCPGKAVQSPSYDLEWHSPLECLLQSFLDSHHPHWQWWDGKPPDGCLVCRLVLPMPPSVMVCYQGRYLGSYSLQCWRWWCYKSHEMGSFEGTYECYLVQDERSPGVSLTGISTSLSKAWINECSVSHFLISFPKLLPTF